MRYLLPLMLVLATCWAGSPLFESKAPKLIQEIEDNYRLPDDVIPTNYVIELTPYLDTKEENNFTFVGHSVINLEVKRPTKTITFHAKQLEIDNIILTYSLSNSNESALPWVIENIVPDEKKDFIILMLGGELYPGMLQLKLSLHYTGVLNDKLRGFYKSSYQTRNETRWLATTHFEPVGARQAFPCWDEPAMKATFDITITPPKGYHAVSNMKSTVKDGKTVFQQTPKMSAYLVAFVVSDYKNKGNNEGNFSVWTRPDAINSTEFAFEIGQETLKKLEKFTGIDYNTLNKGIKLDQISIPDFGAGAMENWGLVTYRESALLYTDGKTTTQGKQSIATVIAHEFSHQWFGNLVTCEWWDYIWLNEGFATFFQYYITEQVAETLFEESWRLMDQFVIKNLQASAFVVDANTKTRSLNSESSAKIPLQIHALFDDIAYKKGASILRMLQKFLTEDVFQKGLNSYLNDNQFNSVNWRDLIHALEKFADNITLPDKVPLNIVMGNWLNKPGYPVVTVKRHVNSSTKADLIQERFFLAKPVNQDTTQWYIPITYVTEEAPEDTESVWIKPEEVKTVELSNDTQWVLFNKDQTGYYRVNYDVANWNLLAVYLKSVNYKNISSTNRAQLIDDALNLARAGYLLYNSSLQITKYLEQEIDYIPWYAAVRAFDYLDRVLQDSKKHDKYHAYVAQQIEDFAKEVNYTNPEEGTHVTKLGKVLALNTACKYGQKDCEDFAKKELNEWLDKEEKTLSPDLRSGIICAGLRKESAETWSKTVKKYQKTQDKDERADIEAGLGCATSNEIVNKFFDLTKGENPVIDIFSAMNSIAAGNANSFDILLNFINANIEKIKEADKDNTKLPALLNKLANKVTTSDQYAELSLVAHRNLQEIEKFESTYAIENLDWISSYRAEVEQWIEDNYKEQVEPNSASSFALASFLMIIPVLLARFN